MKSAASLMLATVGTALFPTASVSEAATDLTCTFHWIGFVSPENGVPRQVDNIRTGLSFELDISTGEITGEAAVWLNPVLVSSGLAQTDSAKTSMFYYRKDFVDDRY